MEDTSARKHTATTPLPTIIHHIRNGRRSTYIQTSTQSTCALDTNPHPTGSAPAQTPTFSALARDSNITNSASPSQRSAALKIDWANLGTKLGLRGSTAQALQTFKKRNDDARRKVQILSEQPQTVDFSHYRSVLKNQAIVDDIEKQFSAFAVKKYDVNRQIKAIEAYEAQAVKSAEETKGKVDAELKDLEATLKNIESARPFEDLTVVRIGKGGLRARNHVIWVTDMQRRMRLWPLARTSTSVSSSSSLRAAGKFPATRYVSTVSSKWGDMCLITPTGEIRRPFRAIEGAEVVV